MTSKTSKTTVADKTTGAELAELRAELAAARGELAAAVAARTAVTAERDEARAERDALAARQAAMGEAGAAAAPGSEAAVTSAQLAAAEELAEAQRVEAAVQAAAAAAALADVAEARAAAEANANAAAAARLEAGRLRDELAGAQMTERASAERAMLEVARQRLALKVKDDQRKTEAHAAQIAAAEAAAAADQAKKAAKLADIELGARKLSASEVALQKQFTQLSARSAPATAAVMMRELATVLFSVATHGRAAKAEQIVSGGSVGARREALRAALAGVGWTDATLAPTAAVQPWWAKVMTAAEAVPPSIVDVCNARPAKGDSVDGAWTSAFFDLLDMVTAGASDAVVGVLEKAAAAEIVASLPFAYEDANTKPLVEALAMVGTGIRLRAVLTQPAFAKLKFIASRRTPPPVGNASTTKTTSHAYNYVAAAGDVPILHTPMVLVRSGGGRGEQLVRVRAAFDTCATHTFVNREWFFGLPGVAESAAATAGCLHTISLADGTVVRLGEAVEPWFLVAATTGGERRRIVVYPLTDLPELLLVGLRGMRELGGTVITVDTSGATSVVFPAPGVQTAAVAHSEQHAERMQAIAMWLTASDGTHFAVELEGPHLISSIGSNDESLALSPIQLAAVHKTGEAMMRASRGSGAASAREARVLEAGRLEGMAHVYLFRPDLEQAGYDAAMDPIADPAPGAASGIDLEMPHYRYADGLQKFAAMVRAVDGMPADEMELLIDEVAKIDDLTLLSSEAPPRRFGPVRGPGSVHRIRLLNNADISSVFDRPRPRSRDKEDALQKTKQVWLQFGIIEPVAYGQTRVVNVPVVAVKRGLDGSVVGYRVAVDFRKLNAICELDRYAPPSQVDVLDMLSKAWRVTMFDMKSLFNQFSVREEDRYLLTTLFGPGEMYQFVGAPFGLASIMATTQRFMDENFRTAICKPYVDDCGIAHAREGDWATLRREVVDFLLQCKRVNMAVNLDKGQIATETPVSLGHNVDCRTHTYKPHHARLRVLAEFSVPQTNQALRRFLSMAAAWARFVPGWAMVATRMRAVIHKSAPLKWSDDALAAFHEARRMLAEACSVKAFDEDSATYVFTDASKNGLGWVVAQPAEAAAVGASDGLLRVVACGGRATLAFERRLDVGELELLAFRESLDRDALLILGLKIPAVWCVDNRSVMHIRAQGQPRSEAVRKFLVELQFGDASRIEVRWVPSGSNPADAISRQWDDDGDDDGNDDVVATRGGAPMAALRARLADEPQQARVLMVRDNAEAPPATPALVDDDDGDWLEVERIADAAVEPTGDGSVTPVARQDAVGPADEEPEREPAAEDEVRLPPIELSEPSDGRVTAHSAATQRATPEAVAAAQLPPVDEADVDAVLRIEALRSGVDEWRRRASIETVRDDSALAVLLRRGVQQLEVPPWVRSLEPARDAWGRMFVLSPQSKRRVMYVPPALVRELVQEMHGTAMGAGVHRRAFGTLQALEQRFYSPLFRQAVREHVDACWVCAQLAPAGGAPKASISHDDTPDRKLGRVYMDVFAIEGQHFVIMVDWLTGALEVEAIERNDGEHICAAIEAWIARYGVMDRLVVDRAKANIGRAGSAMAARHGYTIDPITARNQQANTAERHIRTIKDALRAMVALRTAGPSVQITRAQIDRARMAYMAAVSASRGFAPYELLFNMQMKLPIDAHVGVEAARVRTDESTAERVARERGENDAKVQQARDGMAARHKVDARYRKHKWGERVQLRLGDVVWVENNQNTHATKFKNMIKRGQQAVVVEIDERRNKVKVRDFRTGAPRPGWLAMRRATPVVGAGVPRAEARAPVQGDVEQPVRGNSSSSSSGGSAKAGAQQEAERGQFPIAVATEQGIIRDIVRTETGWLVTLDTTSVGGSVRAASGDGFSQQVLDRARTEKRQVERQARQQRRGRA